MSLIGNSIGNYEIKAQIGEGGMGTVYLGEHPLIGKRVAIKVLLEELVGQAGRRLALLQRGQSGQRHRAPQHRRRRRLRQDHRRPRRRGRLLHHGVSRRRERCRRGSGAPGCRSRRRCTSSSSAARRWPRRHAKGHRSSRPQAREYFSRAARRRQELRQDPRLRHRQADRRRRHVVAQDAHRPGHRHADVHEPGAVRGQRAHRSPQRRLLARHRHVRAAHRRACRSPARASARCWSRT